MVTRTKPGTTVPVEILRDGERRTVQVTVGRLELEATPTQSAGPVSDTAIGVALGNLTPQIRNRLNVPSERQGAVVMQVEPSGAAARAGIRPGDVILEVNRMRVADAAAAAAALRSIGANAAGFVLVWREGQQIFLTVQRD